MSINDKISKILEILGIDGVSGGYLVRAGVLQDKIKSEETFQKSFVLHQEEFLCVGVEGMAMGEGIRWLRFPKRESITDRTTMSTRYFDCACFSPNRDVRFLGFGIFGPFNGNNLIFEVKWRYDGEDSELFEFNTEDYEFDDVNKSYTVDIRKFGCAPIDIDTGDKIYVFAKVKDMEIDYSSRQVFYGYGGYSREYSIFDF